MKYLVVGAGFSGATIARILAEAGHIVHVEEERDHVAGNAYDYINEHGIRVHKYGPHLFHTSNQQVMDFLSRFTEWVPYEHRVKALLSDGTFVTFPPNRETVEKVGKDNLVDTFYRPYTEKMWNRSLEEVAPNILSRVPIREDDEDRYFPKDVYQVMPVDGYTALVERMLDHENISVYTNCEFLRTSEEYYDHVFNSMPIDKYYDFIHGKLEYRSIKFHTVTLPFEKFLPATTVNFTNHGPYTRITEWKNIPGHGHNAYNTTVTTEEPCDYMDNNFERYYPVADKDNKYRYELYKSIPNDKVTFIGRCGQYVYIDMHQAVNSAMRTAMDFVK